MFRWSDGAAHYLAQIRRDGTGQARIPGGPISTILSISPDRRILIALAPDSDRDPSVSSFAIPLAGGPRRRICRGLCTAGWSRDGRFFYVETELASRMATGQTIAIPLAVGAALPEIPPDGFTGANALSLPGAVAIGRAEVVIGPDPTTYAYVQSSVHRNLFRVPLR